MNFNLCYIIIHGILIVFDTYILQQLHHATILVMVSTMMNLHLDYSSILKSTKTTMRLTNEECCYFRNLQKPLDHHNKRFFHEYQKAQQILMKLTGAISVWIATISSVTFTPETFTHWSVFICANCMLHATHFVFTCISTFIDIQRQVWEKASYLSKYHIQICELCQDVCIHINTILGGPEHILHLFNSIHPI